MPYVIDNLIDTAHSCNQDRDTLLMKSRSFSSSSWSFVLIPEHKSNPKGATDLMASLTLPGLSPPVRKTGFVVVLTIESAPYSMARRAYSCDEIQHTLTLVLFIRCLFRPGTSVLQNLNRIAVDGRVRPDADASQATSRVNVFSRQAKSLSLN